MSLRPRRGSYLCLVQQSLGHISSIFDQYWYLARAARSLYSSQALQQSQENRGCLPTQQLLFTASSPCNRPASPTNRGSWSTGCKAATVAASAHEAAVLRQSLHTARDTGDRQQAARLLAAFAARHRDAKFTLLHELVNGQHQHSDTAPTTAAQHLLSNQQQVQSRPRPVRPCIIPKRISATTKQLNKLVAKPRKRSPAVGPAVPRISKEVMTQLQARLYNILQHAASQPHWQDDTPGFLACLEDVKLLFQQIFAAADPKQRPEHCCAVEPTLVSLNQCLDSILPVLLLPKQAPAQNMVGVAEFLQDIMGMDGQQVFKCFREEPSVLYLDVYNDLMPVQGLFDALDWQPEHYVSMIVKHPQILLIPVQQFQRNVGYLMGQGVSKAELLQMWGLRAGLLIEPLRNLHGEVLALRSANRPLQDLALPATQRLAPLPETARDHLKPRRIHDPIEQNPPVLSQSSKVRGAVSALVGTPQAVYIYTQNQLKLLKFKGVYQSFEGKFVVKAPVGRDGGLKRLGHYSNMLEAARAYDEAMFQRFGVVAKHNLNFPAEHIRSVVP